MYWNGADWWAWIPMSLFMIAFWGVLVWGIVRLVAEWRPGWQRRATPLDMLDERLARGEIEIDEYRERRASLGDRRSDRRPIGARPR
jgi:putative membrane protein